MDTRKRTTVERDATPPSSSSMATPPSSRTKKVASRTKGMKKNDFLEKKRSLWGQSVESLNKAYKEAMEIANTHEDVMLLTCEYNRVLFDTNKHLRGVSGEIFAMGNNDGFQLGIQMSPDEDKDTEYLPTLVNTFLGNGKTIQVAAGGLHSAALTEDGKVYTWGVNDDGALGRDVTDGTLHMIKPVEGFGPKDQNQLIGVSCGDSHTVFLTIDGKIYSCGMYKDTDSGKFKDVPPGATKCKGTNTKPVEVILPKPARAIYAGSSFNAAILEDDSMVTWGMGCSGQLARSKDMGAPLKPNNRSDEKPIYDLGKTWVGEEYEVEEEVVETNPRTGKPRNKIVKETKYRYFEDLIAKEFLTPKPPIWATQEKRKVLSIACGELHMLVVARMEGSMNSDVYAAGHNGFGQLGHGEHVKELHELTPIEFFKGKMISRVAAGQSHNLALSITCNALFSWGRSDYGQLGYPVDTSQVGSFESTPAQIALPIEVADTTIKDIAAGGSVSFVIFDNHEVYSWGYGDACTTGFRSEKDIIRPRKLDVLKKYKGNGPAHFQAHQVSAGGQHTLVLVKRFA